MRKLGIVAATVLAAGAIGSASAQTITYTVDCAKGQTIAGAIARADSRSPRQFNNEYVMRRPRPRDAARRSGRGWRSERSGRGRTRDPD